MISTEISSPFSFVVDISGIGKCATQHLLIDRDIKASLGTEERLTKDLFFNMKDKTKVTDENLHHIENNFIALDLIGLRSYDEKLRRKIDEYLDY